MIKYKVKLVFQSNNFPSTIEIKDRSHSVEYQTEDTQLIVDTCLELPNRITIALECDEPGQYLELKEFWLGGIQFETDCLFSLAEYHINMQESPTFNIFYNQSGQVRFDLFDKNPITYHLHWKSKIRGAV